MSLLRIYWRALGYLAADKKRVAFICAANVTLAIVAILEPIMFGRVIDAISDHVDAIPALAMWAGLGAKQGVTCPEPRPQPEPQPQGAVER